MAQTVKVDSAGSEMGLYEAAPEGTVRGAVIVMQEAFGVNAHIEDVTRRFAAAGYHAVAPHVFHRSGDPVIPYEKMATDVMPHLSKLSAEGLEADIDAALKHLAGAGFAPEQIGMVGFCAGGSITLYAAARRAFGAAVTFYGGGLGTGRFGLPPLTEVGAELKTPWLGLYGDLDKSIPVEQVEMLRGEAAKAPVATEVVRYPEADHGFHCDERPATFNAAAAKDGWQRTLAWFDAHLAR